MFLYLEPVQQFENMVRIGGPEQDLSCWLVQWLGRASVLDVTGLTAGWWPFHFYLATLGK